MAKKFNAQAALRGGVAGFFVMALQAAGAGTEGPVTREQFLQLQQQNEQLQQQLQNQQRLIEALTHKVEDIQKSATRPEPASGAAASPAAGEDFSAAALAAPGMRLGKVDISGEGGLTMFSSESQGQNPHPTFRIDEAKLFLEAPVWEDVYFYSELDLASRESTSLGLAVGELYLDFEDVSKLWGRERMLNVRVGQFYIPFGEEYQNRFAIDNPLISHSVSDLWGADAGVEIYGKLGAARYAVAVQNGGGPTSYALQDDKAVAGRLGYDPAKWLHLSASGMRTGNLNVNNGISAIWFGNGWFEPLPGSKATTFHANLVEGDVQLTLPQVQIKAAGGYIDYGDNDPSANHHRDVYYFYAEGVHEFSRELYCAARFSEVFARNGFPIVGGGTMGKYLFGGDLTEEYWRLSLGLGYRFSRNLLVKGEYSFNQGRESDGEFRPGENALAVEAAFKF